MSDHLNKSIMGISKVTSAAVAENAKMVDDDGESMVSIATKSSEPDSNQYIWIAVTVAVIVVVVLVVIFCCLKKCNVVKCTIASLFKSSRDSVSLADSASGLDTEEECVIADVDVTVMTDAMFQQAVFGRGIQTTSKSVYVNFGVGEVDNYGFDTSPHSYVYQYQGTMATSLQEPTHTVDANQDAVSTSSSSSSSSSLSSLSHKMPELTYNITDKDPLETADEDLSGLAVLQPVEEASNEALPDFGVMEFFTHMERSETRTVKGKLMVFISRLVDHHGDCLILDHMGISLTVPPGAILEGCKETIFLILDWDLSDFPHLKPHESIVSPVVHCGPHGLKFHKQCMLSYRHCADDIDVVSVWASQTGIMPTKSWNLHSGAKSANNDIAILQDECQIHTSHFTLFTSLLTTNEVSKKWLQLAAFARPLRMGKFYEIRVYFLNKTPCALQFAEQTEAKQFGTRLLTPAQKFLYIGDGKDMCLELERVSEGWKNQDHEDTEVLPFLSIWHGECPHVQFVFETSGTPTTQINVTFKAYQKSRKSNCIKLKIIDECIDPSEGGTKQIAVGTDHANGQCHSDAMQTSGISNSPRPLTQPNTRTANQEGEQKTKSPDLHRIPLKLRIELQAKLDGTSPIGQDWRAFAEKLGLGRFIHSFERKDSPMDNLMNAFETTGGDLTQLAQIMIDIERHDVHRIIMEYIHEEMGPKGDSSCQARETCTQVMPRDKKGPKTTGPVMVSVKTQAPKPRKQPSSSRLQFSGFPQKMISAKV